MATIWAGGEAPERNFGLDLVRAAATVLVLAVHFFLNSGFYDLPLQGAGMAAGAAARMACMTCVPLFMLLTGYLCVRRQWSPGYYWKLAPILLTYLVAGAVCQVYEKFALGLPVTLKYVAVHYLSFSAAPYGWYVEMYIGLFLLSPFVNAAWGALGPRGRRALCLTLVAMTALPMAANLPGQILPDWWTGIYPLTYYVLGAWLREHPVKWKSGWLLAGWLGLAAGTGLLRFALAHGQNFGYAAVSDWGSLLVLGESVCLFSLLRRGTGARCPRAVRWCVHRVAKLSLAIYLISYITDQIIYPLLREAVPDPVGRLAFLPVMVAVSLVCSGLLGQGVEWISAALLRLLPRRRAGAGQNKTAQES